MCVLDSPPLTQWLLGISKKLFATAVVIITIISLGVSVILSFLFLKVLKDRLPVVF